MSFRQLLVGIACLGLALCTASAATALTAPAPLPTNAADALRTGWYPNQPGLAPATVSSSQFGRLFKVPVDGQVYAQPLVFQNTLLIATEDNNVYGLDPATGAQRWTPRNYGVPFNADDVGCADLSPHVGITGTPTIDPDTGRAYFTAKSYDGGTGAPRYDLHAINVATGVEAPGFPVPLTGHADNNTQIPFNARYQLQRPGLLLLDGVVYAGFAGHCDRNPWKGWIFGVRADTGAITARWIANSNGVDGAGIWQSGGGLVSDGPGRILVTTGNGQAPTRPLPGTSPPDGLGEAIVRLDVRDDGSLRPVDFFAPYDAEDLDTWDADFGSTAPTVLPRPWFGNRRLAVAGGKAGNFYLFDADRLGGMMQGQAGGDDVLQELSSLGGTWSRFAVWPGDGGWIYYPTASNGSSASGSEGKLQALEFGTDADGNPRFSLSGRSDDPFGFGSGAPVVTSVDDLSGSALLWIVYAPNGEGYGAELRAYDPIPVGGILQLRRSFPLGRSSKFASPGIADGRVFVGTRDGFVQGYGVPANAPLVGSSATFPTTIVDTTSAPINVTLTATRALTITRGTVGGPFAATFGSFPQRLAVGDQVTIPVRFRPTTWGATGGTLSLETSEGPVDVGLAGTAEAAEGLLVASTPVVRFGGVLPGGRSTSAATLTNVGATPVVLRATTLPQAPFSLDEPLPLSLPHGGKVTITFTFAPTTTGSYETELVIDQGAAAAPLVLGLTGTSVTAAHLQITPPALDFGAVAVGTQQTRSFVLHNSGGAALTLTKSKPPTLDRFVPATPGAPDGNPIPEGTVIPGDGSITVSVRFSPTAVGALSDTWVLNATDDGGGVREVGISGTGVTPTPPDDGGGGGGGQTPPNGPPAGPEPVPPTPIPPAPAPRPRGEIAGRNALSPVFAIRSLRIRARSSVRVRVSCPRASPTTCRGRLSLLGRTSAHGAHSAALGSASYAIPAGRTQSITVRLTRAARRQLANGRALRGTAQLLPRGAHRAVHAALTLLPPK
ncbi:choice-of-anchor D domain-containing protein [Conexibacter sp. CPCC 206217]|uniref:choice-of-anchor D domain-containing protein n=1 Tax=Conexibacter sp. CPCC 206217 TaxID=3064574 RepID=UPI00271A5DFA|nr:choice-of-anchor D domain-containing protein [Conexibacter sp. CPCC 206217]MDO8210900.1 choice-of-anchor D domain-containing protein [Conexibacter sp. CPCC 206217]